jgi:RimJ/RimL family protein N-acetyltransferase
VELPVVDDSRYFWKGDKVKLRPWRLEDAQQSFIDSHDGPTRLFLQLGVELPTSLEAQRAALEKYIDCKDADGIILFAIENHAGEHVGGISFHSRNRKNGTFGFGISVQREHRRKGYAEDAVKILLRYAFQQQRFQKCNSACVDKNEASIQLHKKLGFKEEGRRRRNFFFNGEFHDDVLFGLTREEFEAQEKSRK